MFEISVKGQNEIVFITKKTTMSISVVKQEIDAGLAVGKIFGPGEFEVGDISVRGISTVSNKTIYDVEIEGVHIGVLDGVEENLDDIVAEILCTSSVRAVREIAPKVVIATGNIDGMVTELKVSAKTDKRYKVKNLASLPEIMEVVVLG